MGLERWGRTWEVVGGQKKLQEEELAWVKVWKGERVQWVCKTVFWPRGLRRVTIGREDPGWAFKGVDQP